MNFQNCARIKMRIAVSCILPLALTPNTTFAQDASSQNDAGAAIGNLFKSFVQAVQKAGDDVDKGQTQAAPQAAQSPVAPQPLTPSSAALDYYVAIYENADAGEIRDYVSKITSPTKVLKWSDTNDFIVALGPYDSEATVKKVIDLLSSKNAELNASTLPVFVFRKGTPDSQLVTSQSAQTALRSNLPASATSSQRDGNPVQSQTKNLKWTPIISDAVTDVYIDFSNIRNNGLIKEFTVLNSWATPQKTDGGAYYNSSINTYNINCKDNTIKYIEENAFADKMGNGDTIQRTVINGNWELKSSSVYRTFLYLNICTSLGSNPGSDRFIYQYLIDDFDIFPATAKGRQDDYQELGIATEYQLKREMQRFFKKYNIVISPSPDLQYYPDKKFKDFIWDDIQSTVRGVGFETFESERTIAEKAENDEIDRKNRASNAAAYANSVRDFPYTAVISCGKSEWENINSLACFAGSSSGAETELELRNGSDYGMYKVYEINQKFRQTSRGIEIPLRKIFSIKAQNSNRFLKLGIRIFDRSGAVIFQQQVAQYGVIAKQVK